jgi:hypothetical protein
MIVFYNIENFELLCDFFVALCVIAIAQSFAKYIKRKNLISMHTNNSNLYYTKTEPNKFKIKIRGNQRSIY